MQSCWAWSLQCFILRVQHSEMNSHASKKCTSAWTAPQNPWLLWSLLDIDDLLHCTVSFNTPFRAHSHCCLWPTSISCANITHSPNDIMSCYRRLEFFKWMAVYVCLQVQGNVTTYRTTMTYCMCLNPLLTNRLLCVVPLNPVQQTEGEPADENPGRRSCRQVLWTQARTGGWSITINFSATLSKVFEQAVLVFALEVHKYYDINILLQFPGVVALKFTVLCQKKILFYNFPLWFHCSLQPHYNCVLSVISLLFTVLNISSVCLCKEQQVVAFLCSSITKCVVKIFCKLIVLLLAIVRLVIKRVLLQLV
jgi:hypothetical protein